MIKLKATCETCDQEIEMNEDDRCQTTTEEVIILHGGCPRCSTVFVIQATCSNAELNRAEIAKFAPSTFKLELPIGSMNAGAAIEDCGCRGRETNDLVLHLVVWEEPDHLGRRHILDVKEQKIEIPAWVLGVDQARLDAFATALHHVIYQVLVAYNDLPCVMPKDLFVRSWDALKLKTAHTVEDFARALRMNSRLGRYLAPVSAMEKATDALKGKTTAYVDHNNPNGDKHIHGLGGHVIVADKVIKAIHDLWGKSHDDREDQ